MASAGKTDEEVRSGLTAANTASASAGGRSAEIANAVSGSGF